MVRRPAKTVRVQADSREMTNVGQRVAVLLVVQGAEVDLGTQILCDGPVTIGRDADLELPLRDGSISRRHCRVDQKSDGAYVLADLGSTNGTRLNGGRIKTPVPLTDGDKIFLGSTIVKFGYADELDTRYHARLETMAATDALTGLLSSRKFDAAFAHAVAEARDTGASLGVLVMDMDGLKQVNDLHGHQMGGYTLVEVAQILAPRFAGRGEVCRFGGDEFAAFVPGLDRPAAAALAEVIRAAIDGATFQRDGVTVHVTLSIGVAALPGDGTTADELFRAADQALYRAKAAGKNRVST
jgi:diguanylate cyclase (GGDEF)-like protein